MHLGSLLSTQEFGVLLRQRLHTPQEFEKNAALFLRSGLAFTLIRHENGAFGKRFLTGEKDNFTIIIILPFPYFPQTQIIKVTSDCSVFKFLSCTVVGA